MSPPLLAKSVRESATWCQPWVNLVVVVVLMLVVLLVVVVVMVAAVCAASHLDRYLVVHGQVPPVEPHGYSPLHIPPGGGFSSTPCTPCTPPGVPPYRPSALPPTGREPTPTPLAGWQEQRKKTSWRMALAYYSSTAARAPPSKYQAGPYHAKSEGRSGGGVSWDHATNDPILHEPDLHHHHPAHGSSFPHSVFHIPTHRHGAF